ncbi:tRNA N6-adenosine(37)-threonylcarbamoyltransferase complex transferase subunit TsaD [Acetobacter orientalis]|uniref:tRNA N6-adenosine(37)-threonylcarbamoyltransferase complex transferase subunit TsaD n=1 Tax=Acetobacter orientalis TaxID=146474 RepID=A0A2Z5ZDR6_9PROT|nr:tRNA N6-adenosine(37)-threonylcarbamoyltransferase complex transferase subunit TsaD [Acetobacter orientalis]
MRRLHFSGHLHYKQGQIFFSKPSLCKDDARKIAAKQTYN